MQISSILKASYPFINNDAKMCVHSKRNITCPRQPIGLLQERPIMLYVKMEFKVEDDSVSIGRNSVGARKRK